MDALPLLKGLAWEFYAFFDSFMQPDRPSLTDYSPQPMMCGASTAVRIKLCASTNRPTTKRTLAKPRTGIRDKPRLQAFGR